MGKKSGKKKQQGNYIRHKIKKETKSEVNDLMDLYKEMLMSQTQNQVKHSKKTNKEHFGIIKPEIDIPVEKNEHPSKLSNKLLIMSKLKK